MRSEEEAEFGILYLLLSFRLPGLSLFPSPFWGRKNIVEAKDYDGR